MIRTKKNKLIPVVILLLLIIAIGYANLQTSLSLNGLLKVTPSAKYTITFDPQGGTVDPTSIIVKANEPYGILPTPIKNGYSFDGWYTSETDSNKIESSTKVTISEDQLLYAHWSIKNFTVTFDANEGTVTTTSKEVPYNTNYGELPTAERTGYTFKGWYTEKEDGTQVTNTSIYTDIDDQTLYAHWEAKSYTVTFNANGGTVSTTTKTYKFDNPYSNMPTPTRSGYTFGGWYTEQTGGTKVTETTTVQTAENHILYAHWVTRITLNASGGTVNPETIDYEVGSTYGSLPTPSKSGYLFGGWFTSTNGTGTKINSGDSVTTSRTIYAFWYRDVPYLKNNFTVTSGNGLYNQSGTYYYKGGGCLNWDSRVSTDSTNNYGRLTTTTTTTDYWLQCYDKDTNEINNYIKIGTAYYRMLELNSQGVKIIAYSNTSLSRAFDSNNTATIFSSSTLYTYLNGTYFNSLKRRFTNPDNIFVTNATFRQTSIPNTSYEIRDYNWYKNYESSNGSNFTATVSIPTFTELCLHSTQPNYTNMGSDYEQYEQTSCLRKNWMIFDGNDATTYTAQNGHKYYSSQYQAFMASTILNGTYMLMMRGEVGYGYRTSNYEQRPVLYLKNTIKLVGDGTYSNPYTIYNE